MTNYIKEQVPTHRQNMSHKSWVYTVNNFRHTEYESCLAITQLANVHFAAVECESTAHIQGYITFKRSKRLSALKKLLPRAHFEPAMGRKDDNHQYIIGGLRPDGTPKSFSRPFIEHDGTQQGARTDLEQCIQVGIESGLKRAATDHPSAFAKFHRGIERAIALRLEPDPRSAPPTVYWLYGDSGIGKTYYAFSKSANVFIAKNAPTWFDGLTNHDWVVFDEFDKRKFPLEELLCLIDRYPIRVPIKGGTVEFNPPNIVITSSMSPQTCIPSAHDYSQVERRLTKIGTRDSMNVEWTWLK